MSDTLKVRLLVVDDEQSIRKLCMTIGGSLGYSCTEAESAETALARIEQEGPDLILTDLKLPTRSGVELLRQAKSLFPRTEVAIMTGHGSIESAVDAMKLGAYDYIEKPFRVEKMRLLLQRMAEKVRLVTENEFLRERVSTEDNLDGIVGASANIQDVLRMVSRLKDTRTPVLIAGESGTGKELVARAIHFRGAMAQTPFVAVDCGSLVPTLMESELFGYEKGAFTGAIKSKAGLFQAADGGTIFLDEVGELPSETQIALLRVLQEREFQRVGGNESLKTDVRVVAATNRDLQAAISDGRFRDDLFYRLNVFPIEVPALRERKEDIPLLVEYFVGRYATQAGKKITGISKRSMELLQSYKWPGNIRELQNVIERSVIISDSKDLSIDESWLVGRSPGGDSATQPFSETLLAREKEMIEAALAESNGRVSGPRGAAAKLGIPQSTLDSKIKALKINKQRFRKV